MLAQGLQENVKQYLIFDIWNIPSASYELLEAIWAQNPLVTFTAQKK